MYQGQPKPREAKPFRPGSRYPFKRWQALMAQVEEIRQKYAFGSIAYQLAITALPPYVGRGHGGHHRSANRLISGRWNQSRSKYTPHQGKSEVARRVFQASPKWVRDETRRMEVMI